MAYLFSKNTSVFQHTQNHHDHQRRNAGADENIQISQRNAAEFFIKPLNSVELAGIRAGSFLFQLMFVFFLIHKNHR